IFVYDSEIPKAARYLSVQPPTYSSRIRIVNASGNEAAPTLSPANPIEIIVYLEKSFKLWITKELQEATSTQVEGRSISKPSWIIEDLFNGGVSFACKDVHNLPVAVWWSTTAASLISQQGNKEHGHGARVFKHLAQQRGTSLAELGKMYLQGFSNRLVCIPGVPAHYEWELVTQYLPFVPPFIAYMIGRREHMIKQVDKIICCTTFEMEPISAASLANALSKPIEPFFIGPAVDLASLQQPDPDSPVTQFLDRTYAEKGAHSVIYVAFGTVFFPPQGSTSHLTTILDEIPKAGFRFIFTLSSRSAKLDQSWINAHVQAGNAMFPEWTNQTAVLEHPAIHYFLSHGGWSSSTEALVRGVPMIFWPFVSDQPANSVQIATVHNCGFELLQVRTGPAKSTAYEHGTEIEIVGTDDAVREEMKKVLELSKGPRGEHQRVNARLLGKVITGSLGPGGSGDVWLDKFGKVLGLV
ncbi:hypothetical protein FRC11_010665, partial [Ceratobasidium sp. 423]